MTMLLKGAGSPGRPPTLFLDETGLGSNVYASWSETRKLRAAYAGSAIRVRRSSDSAEQDIGFSGIELDTASLASFVGASDGFVVTRYDQSGNGRNATQATTTKQPKIVSAGTILTVNGKPASLFDDSNDDLSYTLNAFANFTFFIVQQTTGDGVLVGNTGANAQVRIGTTGINRISIYFGGTTQYSSTMAVDRTVMSLIDVVRNTTTTLRVNQNGTNYLNVGNVLTANLNSIGSTLNSTYIGGHIPEVVLYSAELGTTELATARANINAFYGLY